MSISTVLDDYKKIAQAMSAQAEAGQHLPSLESQLFSVDASPETKTNSTELSDAIQHFGAARGWLGYQSGNQHLSSLDKVVLKDSYGALLNAELTNDQGQSLHIRYNGQGGWIVTSYEYDSGDQYIADRVSYVSSFDDKIKLSYLRFWKVNNNGASLGVNPVFACFTGFGD